MCHKGFFVVVVVVEKPSNSTIINSYWSGCEIIIIIALHV